jgi:hypothetical protein
LLDPVVHAVRRALGWREDPEIAEAAEAAEPLVRALAARGERGERGARSAGAAGVRQSAMRGEDGAEMGPAAQRHITRFHQWGLGLGGLVRGGRGGYRQTTQEHTQLGVAGAHA